MHLNINLCTMGICMSPHAHNFLVHNQVVHAQQKDECCLKYHKAPSAPPAQNNKINCSFSY